MASKNEVNVSTASIMDGEPSGLLQLDDNRASFLALGIDPEDALLLESHSLTIRDGILEITDKTIGHVDKNRLCCGFDGQTRRAAEEITLHNVLWAQVSASDTQNSVHITYAKSVGKKEVKPVTISISIDENDFDKTDRWVERLLSLSYSGCQQAKRLKVLINPNGGRGYSKQLYDSEIAPILAAAKCTVDLEATRYQGHAVEIAQELDINAYDAVVCVSGDGIPHEIFNGLGKRLDAVNALRKLAVCQLPAGSGNGMCWNLLGTDCASAATVALVKGKRTPLDLASVTYGDERVLSFLSQAVGIIAEIDLATEGMRWIGDTRFAIGFFQRVVAGKVFPCDVAVKVAMDDKEEIRNHCAIARDPPARFSRDSENTDEGLPKLEYGTVNDELPEDWVRESHPKLESFYCGNMTCMSADSNFFPAARPNDGYLDLITYDADIGRGKSVKIITSIETGKHYELSEVVYRKIHAFRIIPKSQKDGYISIDGERVPFGPIQMEIHKALGTVLALNTTKYATPSI